MHGQETRANARLRTPSVERERVEDREREERDSNNIAPPHPPRSARLCAGYCGRPLQLDMPSLWRQLADAGRAAASLASSLVAPTRPRPITPPRPVEPLSPRPPAQQARPPPAPAAPPSHPAAPLEPPPPAPQPSSTLSSSTTPPARKPVVRAGIKLRPYQVDCVRAVLDEVQRGDSSRLGVSAPTGAFTSRPPARLAQLP